MNMYSIFSKKGNWLRMRFGRKIGIPDFSTKPTNYYNLDVIISVGYQLSQILRQLNHLSGLLLFQQPLIDLRISFIEVLYSMTFIFESIKYNISPASL